MTLLNCESFESFDPTDLDKTIKRQYGFSGTLDTSIFKTGSQSVRLWANQACNYSTGAIVNNRVFTGFHFYVSAALVTHLILAYNNENGQTEFSVGLTGGYLACYRGLASVLLATGSTQLQSNTWYYIEVKATVVNSTSFGDVIVRINEVTDIEMGAGQDTSTYNGTLTAVVLYNTTTGVYNYYDNWYVCNDQGSYNNTFLGECVVECLRPNADGNSSQFDGSDGNQINNYLLVDDVFPDDTAEYVEAQNLNEKDLYNMANLSIGAASVKGVKVVTAMYRTTYGKRFMKHVVRTNGTDYEGSQLSIGEGEWMYGSNLWELNPDTGVLWTEGQIGSLECGFKISE